MTKVCRTQHFTSLVNSVYKSVKIFRASLTWAMYFGSDRGVKGFAKIEIILHCMCFLSS